MDKQAIQSQRTRTFAPHCTGRLKVLLIFFRSEPLSPTSVFLSRGYLPAALALPNRFHSAARCPNSRCELGRVGTPVMKKLQHTMVYWSENRVLFRHSQVTQPACRQPL